MVLILPSLSRLSLFIFTNSIFTSSTSCHLQRDINVWLLLGLVIVIIIKLIFIMVSLITIIIREIILFKRSESTCYRLRKSHHHHHHHHRSFILNDNNSLSSSEAPSDSLHRNVINFVTLCIIRSFSSYQLEFNKNILQQS